MTLAAGVRLGRYEVRSQLGTGGMGEVYLARDTQLERTVALKILPATVAANPDRMRRFVQEAKTASALNHPNIITIHEIGESEGTHFIATEFIDGETLRPRIRNAPVKLGEVLDVAAQIASALSAAHAAGIVHRDIKPENTMLRRDGIVKVLDFGLAKLAERLPPDSVDTEAPTRAVVDTDSGVVMGTAVYMSPEQARGLQVDARTDVFSLGVLIYEMVTGRLPFEGSNTNEILASILNDKEPSPLARYAREVPAELERIVTKALRKEREQRYQTTKDLLLDLQSLKQQVEFEAKLERSTPPEFRVATSTSSGQSKLATASGAVAATAPASATPAASSAKYIVSGIRQHKLAAAIALIVLVAGIAVVLVAGIAGLSAYLHTRNTEVAIESIAVLPFENRSNDPDADYISDGITESIINSLTRLPNLKVIPRSVAFRYKGKAVDPQKAGDDLRVNAVLTGRVVQRGDSLTISVELDDVRYGKQLWGEQYNRKLADLLAVQTDIASEISQRLRSQLTGEERRQLAKGSTKNPEAYQLYLKGNYYTSKFTKDGFRKGIGYFNRAIAMDPNYALAYDGLAFNYNNSGDWLIPPNEAAPKARDAAQRALAIDETLAGAHLSLAIIAHWYDWDWATAEREFKRAIELNPNDPRPHGYYSWYLVLLGRNDQALAEAKRGQQLDPVSPEANLFLGSVLVFARQYDLAIEQLRNTVDLDSTYWYAHDFLGRAYEAKGKLPEAIAEFQRALQLEDGNAENWSNLGHAYALSGKRAEAQKIIGDLRELSAHSYVAPYNFAAIYAGLGDKDQAFAWLDRAYADRSGFLAFYLRTDAHMDSLRSDPRFAELMRRIGLPQWKPF